MTSRNIVRVEQTCRACPSQWDLEADDGTGYYARYRYGYFYIALGSGHDELYGLDVGGPSDGVMSTKDMLRLIERLGFTSQDCQEEEVI